MERLILDLKNEQESKQYYDILNYIMDNKIKIRIFPQRNRRILIFNKTVIPSRLLSQEIYSEPVVEFTSGIRGSPSL